MLVVLGGLAVGAWYVARERSREAERLVLLQSARDHHPDAHDRLLAHLERHPDDADVLEALVEWQLWAKVPFAVVEPHLDRFCTLRSDNMHGFRVRARLRVQNGRPAEGLADGLRVLEFEPEDHNTRLLVAIAAAEAGQPDVAVQHLTRLLESTSLPRADLATKLVRAHLQANRAGEAEQALNRYFPASDESAEILMLRGRVHQVAGRHDDAIAVLRRAADKSIDHRETALYHVLESQRSVGRETDVEKTLREIDQFKVRQRHIYDARQQPDNMAIQVRAAQQLIEDGKPGEAVAILEVAMRRLGKNIDAAIVLAQAYRRVGRFDRAEEWERFAKSP